MDQIFALVTDKIALSGIDGIELRHALNAVVSSPRSSLLTYLASQFAARPSLFVAKPDFSASPDVIVIIADQCLRRRALGFSSLEHPALRTPAWSLLEHVGRAGPDGILQSELGPLVGLQANMVHHYIGSLSARRLVARRKVVLTRHKRRLPTSSNLQSPSQSVPQNHPSTPATTVTFTSVIVLARFAANIAASTAAKPVAHTIAPASLPPLQGDVAGAEGPAMSVIDLTMDTRMERVLEALRVPPHIRAEKDLKNIAVPDSDCPENVSRELFQRRRHRAYRALRTKLLRTGVISVTEKECQARNGRLVGVHTCLRLSDMGKQKLLLENSRDGPERKSPASQDAPRSSHPLLKDGRRARFLAEVDIVEQVYRLLERAGAEGISVPELHAYLDDGTELTAAVSKRLRSIATIISRTDSTVETQWFDGSAMYIRIALRRIARPEDHLDENLEGGASPDGTSADPAGHRFRGNVHKRRKIGLTALGEQRQAIVCDLLKERKAIIMETLGREVARVENSGLGRVDPKVMRRIINGLVTQNRIKIITTTKPAIKENRRSQTITLGALPFIDERSEEVRNIVSVVVNRALYGQSEEGKEKSAKPKKKRTAADDVIVEADFADDECIRDHDLYRRDMDLRAAKRKKRGDVKKTTRKRKMEFTIGHPSEFENNDRASVIENNPMNTVIDIGEGEGTTTRVVPDGTGMSSRQKGGPRKVKKARMTRSTKEKPLANKGSKEKENEIIDLRSEVNGVVGKGKGDGKKASSVLIQSQTRDLTRSRIGRLRAIDYGWMKGKMARVRRFHKRLFHIVHGNDGSSQNTPSTILQSTIEATKEVDRIGKFTIYSCLREMTVGDYAATVGIYGDHGDLIDSIGLLKIAEVSHVMEEEITSNQASRQILGLVQTLTKLDLVESDVDSYWSLCGGGIIRDFGRGLPSGVVPHGIVFQNVNAVDAYWVELEQFARCRMSRKPVNPELRAKSANKDGEGHVVGDIYFPVRWDVGLQRLLKDEQLNYEIILQRLSGVEIPLPVPKRLDTANFLTAPLKWFSVEELDDEFERIFGVIPKSKRNQKNIPSVDKVLLYSRFRTKNPIPKWFHNHESAKSDGKNGDVKISKDFVDNSCMLQLRKKESGVEGLHVRGAMPSVFDSNHHRYFKSRIKKPSNTQAPPEAKVNVKEVVPLVRLIVSGRAVSYYRNDSQGLDWKNIPTLVRWELGKETAATTIESAVERESLRRAIVAVCEISMVRAAFDILSLKMVLQIRQIAYMETPDDIENWAGQSLGVTASRLIEDWTGFEELAMAIMMEVKDDVRHSSRISLTLCEGSNLSSDAFRRQIFNRKFEMTGLRHGREAVLAHMIGVMASRFRRITDIRLRGNLRHAILLCESYAHDDGTRRTTSVPVSPLGAKQEVIGAECSGKSKLSRDIPKEPAKIMATENEAGKKPSIYEDRTIPKFPTMDVAQSKWSFNDTSGKKAGCEEDIHVDFTPQQTGWNNVLSVDVPKLPPQPTFPPVPTFPKLIPFNAAVTEEPVKTVTMSDESQKEFSSKGVEVNDGVKSTENAQPVVSEENCAEKESETGSVEEKRSEITNNKVTNNKLTSSEEGKTWKGMKNILDGSVVSGYKMASNGKYAPELVELVVSKVVFEKKHIQENEENVSLLRIFTNEELAEARDRMILRGSISLFEDRESENGYFAPCKTDANGVSEATKKSDDELKQMWLEDLRSVVRDKTEEKIEVLKLWNDVCLLERKSTLGAELTARYAFFESQLDLQLVPSLARTTDQGEARPLQLLFRCSTREKAAVLTEARDGAGESVISRRVTEELMKAGCGGLSIQAIIESVKAKTQSARVKLARALHSLMRRGMIVRYAVETEAEEDEWRDGSGVLYLHARHAGPLSNLKWPIPHRVLPRVMQMATRTPGICLRAVVAGVCAKVTGVCRQAVADLIFEQVNCGALRKEVVHWRDHAWQCVDSGDYESFIDGLTTVMWGERIKAGLQIVVSKIN